MSFLMLVAMTLSGCVTWNAIPIAEAARIEESRRLGGDLKYLRSSMGAHYFSYCFLFEPEKFWRVSSKECDVAPEVLRTRRSSREGVSVNLVKVSEHPPRWRATLEGDYDIVLKSKNTQSVDWHQTKAEVQMIPR